MKDRVVDFFRRNDLKRNVLGMLPAWMKSSATQQGLMFGGVSLVSLVLMAAVTFVYVEHELKDQNNEDRSDPLCIVPM